MKYCWFVFIVLFSKLLPAQDSIRILTQEAYFQWIQAHHPLVRQANLLTAAAEASLLEARGGFDPKLVSELAQKSFDGKNYYTLTESGFSIPTWYGLELKGLFNTASGINTNPENTLPVAGQALLGVKATLGQGLFIDERRAMLQKARVLKNANEAERLDAINNILLDAGIAYWEWVKAYGKLGAIEQALGLSQQRLDGIVESFQQGDRPAMDTLEAYIQVQNWTFESNDARLAFRNSGLLLSNYLWYEDNTPLEISESVRPPLADTLNNQQPFPGMEDLLRFSQSQHPKLQGYQFKLAQLNIDRRLALEAFKPRLDITYNLLGDGFRMGGGQDDGRNGLEGLLLQNFKWGLNFSFPVFLRKERGKLELNRLKIVDTDLAFRQKQLEIGNKVREAYAEWQNTQQQIGLYQAIVANYQLLLEAEMTRFQLGESSIFLLNTREQKLIEAQVKLIGLRADFQKNRLKTGWASGRIN
ncbi:MAG: TolC family protein [Saprospiraceae bacterium]|nr:TolC family protein [Saprospiraceae bacterium]MDZ4705870.1 TolC family protein [Saprospiraceae bacterium]